MIKIVLSLSFVFSMIGCSQPTNHSGNIIVIDAGHGGHDTGAIAGGKKEKDLVLEVSRKLYYKFKNKGYKIYVTRGRDHFLRLSQRTRIADKKDAQVFISIHANAIANKHRFGKAEGIETYYLQKTRDARSQRIASRENASVLKGADTLSQNVIVDSVLSGPKIIESHKLAIDVQQHMVKSLRHSFRNVKDGKVRPAPFYVLVGASRPSILIELGYITNPKERKRLFMSKYQDRIIEGIVSGVSRYIQNRKRELGF